MLLGLHNDENSDTDDVILRRQPKNLITWLRACSADTNFSYRKQGGPLLFSE